MDIILLPQDFKEFLALLNDLHVEYPLVDDYAVGYYGYPRATADMDILISLTHLKTNKLTSGRHKDLDDLENLP